MESKDDFIKKGSREFVQGREILRTRSVPDQVMVFIIRNGPVDGKTNYSSTAGVWTLGFENGMKMVKDLAAHFPVDMEFLVIDGRNLKKMKHTLRSAIADSKSAWKKHVKFIFDYMKCS